MNDWWVTRCTLIVGLILSQISLAIDELPSWVPGDTKRSIIEFVNAVGDPSSESFVPVAERIAVFDHDGTLWAEQPIYAQIHFAIDQVLLMAPGNPQWHGEEPFASVLRGDFDSLFEQGTEAIGRIVAAAQSEVSVTEFDHRVRSWLATARHPGTARGYQTMAYQPMLELLNLLRTHQFKSYIVSGGSTGFIRAFAESVYGVPPERVIGSFGALRFEVKNGQSTVIRGKDVVFMNNGEGKVFSIIRQIGRRPIVAFGNSDGDIEMLRWTRSGDGQRLVALVHHTDAEREWAYDRDSQIGALDNGLILAESEDWTVVDMARDWRVVFKVREQADEALSNVELKTNEK